MSVMVALENVFVKTPDGRVSADICDYNFWQRYLQVFDEVIVFARVKNISEERFDKSTANGPGVSFIELPAFIGPWQYLKKYPLLRSMAKKEIFAFLEGKSLDGYVLCIKKITR